MRGGLLLATAAAVTAAAAASPAAAQVSAPHVWAVRGVYGFDAQSCGTEAGLEAAMIAPEFCATVAAAQAPLAERFQQAMLARFPGAEAKFAQSLPAGTTPNARLKATLIASLRLTRATMWRVDKAAGSDGFLPVTLTLDIANADTGEVVFTRSRSAVGQGVYPTAQVEQRLRAELPAHLDATMQALVTEAAAAWKPYAQSAKIVGKVDAGYVIDRGRAQGIRAGASVGSDVAEGEVAYAGAGYAIVRPLLGDYREGQVLTRTAVTPVALLAKPSVLVAVDRMPRGYGRLYLTEILQDALGAGGGFAPMPVAPGFARLRAAAVGEAGAEAGRQRALPDYVARVSVVPLPSAVFASNIPGVTIERHQADAFVDLVDRSGRVVYSAHGTGLITDQISGDTRFSPDQRRDTVVRNALIDAAAKLARFKPQPLQLPIATAGADRILIADKGGALPLGAQLVVLRNEGRKPGIEGPVFAPVGLVRTVELAEGGLIAVNADAAKISLRAKDVVAIDQAGKPLLARRALVQCAAPVDDRGSVAAGWWSIAAESAFAGQFAAPVRIAGLPGLLARYRTDFAGWDSFAPAQPVTTDQCFRPVIAFDPGRGKGGAQYGMTVGYTLMRGATKVAGQGLEAMLSPTEVPAGTPAPSRSAMLEQDLMANALPLAISAAAALKPVN
ncbi:hypothetical protein [Sphingomonas sanxanigenens]|uniref:Uncharacterized protein n=1 Tax=Sphingomonas sanxanigenens DSM 19645 = NX02 TaxID=1123269 RepID=W0A9P3_9SPHN|nr:hypothetical protein [Sphingomonas sanxanigenens]AHE52395.1 hypothetical protein NX02_03205 [Sphingomonas sanxanigenens DSM 19645 = NX02]